MKKHNKIQFSFKEKSLIYQGTTLSKLSTVSKSVSQKIETILAYFQQLPLCKRENLVGKNLNQVFHIGLIDSQDKDLLKKLGEIANG